MMARRFPVIMDRGVSCPRPDDDRMRGIGSKESITMSPAMMRLREPHARAGVMRLMGECEECYEQEILWTVA